MLTSAKTELLVVIPHLVQQWAFRVDCRPTLLFWNILIAICCLIKF